MKFCVPYYQDFRYLSYVDEIILRYSQHNNNIIDFVISRIKSNQRVVIDITEKVKEIEDLIPILKKLKQEHENMVIKTYQDQYAQLKDAGLSYFFSDFCRTDDEVYAFIKRGVTDVYIVENLGFSLSKIGEYCHSKGVNVRVIPNMAQHALGQKYMIPAPCKFFIRPEDRDIYENYVDVYEFICPLDRLSVVFKVYKDKQWLGDLNNLILGLDEEFYNSGIVPSFGPARLSCGHKCMQEKCTLCLDMQTISKQFNSLNLEVKRTRDKDWELDEFKANQKVMQSEQETDTVDASKIPEE